MNSILKWFAVFIGMICLALFFPFVRNIFDVADANGTGILYMAGTSTNNGFMAFMPVLIPVVLFIIMIIYAVRKDDNNTGMPM